MRAWQLLMIKLTAGISIATCLGVVSALVAFGIRFLGFRGLANDHYMHLAWAQQVLLGEVPGRDFIEPGMPLAIAVSAIGQVVWHGPLGEAVLSIAMLAAAAGITATLVALLSRSALAGLAAALLQIALFPRLYSYPKVLVPTVALLILLAYTRRPTRRTLAVLSLWTVIAFLLRHDLGLVAGVATTLGVLLTHDRDWPKALRAAGTFIVFGLVFVAPYLILVQATEGLAEHVRAGIEFGKSDAHQLLSLAVPFSYDATALLFWAIHLTLAAGALVLALRWRETGRVAPAIAAALALLFLYRLYVLRHPLVARLPDLAAVLTIPAVWVSVEYGRLAWQAAARPVQAVLLGATSVVLATTVVAGTVTMRNLGDDLRWTNVAHGLSGMLDRANEVSDDGAVTFWPRYWPAGELPEVVRYLAACTAPSDRILITWPAPEFYIHAGRGFAAGHVWFVAPKGFVSRQDQALMLQRLQAQSVPIALVNETRYDEFSALPDVTAYLERRYETVGEFAIRGGDRITIRLNRSLTASARYKDGAWPCFPVRL